MSKIVKLHTPSGQELWVRPDHIQMVHASMIGTPAGANATVYFDGGTQWHVKDTLAEVLALVRL
jgi:hypothetical protein